MKALIFNNKVVDTSETEFPVSPEMSWMDASEDCEKGWRLVDGILTPKVIPENSPMWDQKRKIEYPTIAELTVALYDTDDKAAIDTKRAAVKTKWPKDNSGPVE